MVMPHGRNGEGDLPAVPHCFMPSAAVFRPKIGPLVERRQNVYFQRTACHKNNRCQISESTAVAERSKYQQNIIKNYYQNQGAILLQRLGEQVTELYLAEGKARAKRWKDIAKILEKLKVPPARIENLAKARRSGAGRKTARRIAGQTVMISHVTHAHEYRHCR